MKRLKNVFVLILLCAVWGSLPAGLTGCESVHKVIKDKFIPKKKEEEKVEVKFYEQEYYAAYPNATLYDNHYNYWKSWEQELIQSFSGNNYKKMAQCAKFSVSEMQLMRKYLVDPKASELDKWIREIEVIERKINQGGLSEPSKLGMRSTVEKHLRSVRRRFQPKNVKDFIKPDVPRPQQEQAEEILIGEEGY
jgi:hypothetical protein